MYADNNITTYDISALPCMLLFIQALCVIAFVQFCELTFVNASVM